MNEDYGSLLYNFGRNYEENKAEELTCRIVEFFRKHPEIPPTEENIIEQVLEENIYSLCNFIIKNELNNI